MHVGMANPRWRGKHFQHSRRMRNPKFYVSGKRPMSLLCYQFNYVTSKFLYLYIVYCILSQYGRMGLASFLASPFWRVWNNVCLCSLYCLFVLHCTVLHCTALHCAALRCVALNCIALHCIALHGIVFYCILLYCIDVTKSSSSAATLHTRVAIATAFDTKAFCVKRVWWIIIINA